ncbi:MAG: tetratricopeptide repeat protein [Terrimicrobiaceae bacterium]
MKASVSPAVAILAALLLACVSPNGHAQDVVVQKDGQRREGQILGVKSDAIRIKVGPVETGVPMANVASVIMAAPKAYADSLAQWQKGDAAKTLTLLTPLVENFNGLKTNWAERASALLGEVYLSAGQTEKAEAAFAGFQKLYPEAASTADVGLARLAIAKKDFDAARVKLVPIVEKAKTLKLPDSGDSAVYGQALFLLGQVQESSGENAEALENYLLVVTLFHEDDAATAKAAERANVLKEKNVIVP